MNGWTKNHPQRRISQLELRLTKEVDRLDIAIEILRAHLKDAEKKLIIIDDTIVAMANAIKELERRFEDFLNAT